MMPSKGAYLTMSVYDSPDLMTFNAAAREYNVPVSLLEMAVSNGSLRSFDEEGERKLMRHDVAILVKRMVTRGAGNRVISRLE
jgi:hypothetical protein